MTGGNGKSVSFGTITILEFPIMLGDNPGVSSGAPLTIDWVPVDVNTRDINLYDYLRSSQRKSSKKKFQISVPRRAQMLIKAGYSIDEIANAVLMVEEIQRQRQDSAQSAGGLGERVQDLLSNTGKKLPLGFMKGVLRMTKPKQNTLQARSA